jgi:hypothetical protein
MVEQDPSRVLANRAVVRCCQRPKSVRRPARQPRRYDFLKHGKRGLPQPATQAQNCLQLTLCDGVHRTPASFRLLSLCRPNVVKWTCRSPRTGGAAGGLTPRGKDSRCPTSIPTLLPERGFRSPSAFGPKSTVTAPCLLTSRTSDRVGYGPVPQTGAMDSSRSTAVPDAPITSLGN